MKKFYCFYFVLFFFLIGNIGFSQSAPVKTKILPDRGTRDSRFTVQATVMDNDTWCQVAWPDPENYFWEFEPDDGEADDFFIYAQPENMSANKFTPNGYPFIVTGGCIYVGDSSFPGPFLGTSFRVLVYDDDGGNGLPGTALDSIDVIVNNYGWVEFEGMTATFTEGDFYLARFSDFYPCGSSLYCDTTILDTINSSEYHDYTWDTLAAGLYSYGVKTHFTGGEWSDYDISNDVVRLMYSFPPSCFYQADTANMPLIICPPHDINGAIPNYFLGFNLYGDFGLIDFLPATTTFFSPGLEQPGIFEYELTAVYDFSSFGYPGETIESCALTSFYIVRYGYSLDFLEQWNTGTFETNNWATDGINWSVNGMVGNPDPSVEFTWDPILTNYQESLESYPLQADFLTEGKIYLDFDIKLDAVFPTGNELLVVQVWNWESQIWEPAEIFSNLEGSFDWVSEHLDITSMAMSQVFKIRFSAMGENSINIVSWFIDNIHVYRECKAPTNLTVLANNQLQAFELNWEPPAGLWINEWIRWDDGANSGNSIGGPTEFCVAARWTPDQLIDYEGASLTEIAFFPGEQEGTYKVRVWVGEGGTNMIVDQEVTSPIAGLWNYVTLTTPVPVDITQEFWVGYYIYSLTGYPAGCDNGPAIDGYGNMLYYGVWYTLLEINPDLNYNWNIAAHLQKYSNNDTLVEYAIYRADNGNPYYLRDFSYQNYYMDDSSICDPPGSVHLYKITAIYSGESDTCESDYSNEAGDVCEGTNDISEESFVRIYPNPCNEFIRIASSEELGFVSLYNSFGELMLKKKIDNRQYEIPVTDYAAGVYLVRFETSGQFISRKVVVMH